MNSRYDYLSSLNDAQKKAVTAPLGAQLVVAGAGSGKTRVITSRIAYLIQEMGIPARNIIALTFTNKAGKEMKERIASFLPDTALPFVGTFHSYCVRLLRQNKALLPYPDFTILDTEDQRGMLKKILKSFGLEKQLTPAKIHGMISFDKNHLPGQQPYDQPPTPYFQEVKSAYEEEKARAHAFDFDDLLLVTLDLFGRSPGFAQAFQNSIRHILVDEYQDTNQIQHELLRRMALGSDKKVAIDSLCGVGDEDQSIYSWRGAQSDNMAHFARDFGPVTQVKIEQNYRSVQPILQAANHVIGHNMNRNEKRLWSDKQATGRILSLSFQNGYHEAETIAQSIKQVGKHASLKSIAILYRTHHQSRMLEEALMHAALPYVIVGGIRFYERKEIKDILAYMRLFANPFDRPAFLRVINTPTRGIGARTEALIMQRWSEEPVLDFKQLLTSLVQDPTSGLTKRHHEGVQSFLSLYTTYSSRTKPSQLIAGILAHIGYRTYLRNTVDPSDLQAKIENIDELEQAVAHFEDEHKDAATLEKFLEDVALMQEQANNVKEGGDVVSLMTLHAAKGLEFDTVIIAGLEEELFPSSRSMGSNKDMEEERRLFYVGVTRAKEWLLLTNSNMRTTYGMVTTQPRSRFLDEMPQTLMQEVDCSSLLPTDRLAHVCQWRKIPAPQRATTFSSFQRPSAVKKQPARRTPSKFNGYSQSLRSPQKTILNAHRTTGSSSSGSSATPWRRKSPVIHPKFGVGIIEKVVKKSADEWYLTISFKSGQKTLSSKFVSKK